MAACLVRTLHRHLHRIMNIVRPRLRVPSFRARAVVAVASACWLVSLGMASTQAPLQPSQYRNHPAIAYGATPTADPVARLGEALKRGDVKLTYTPGRGGYLRSILDALAVPVESQMLVFSKTSFQAPRIGPKNPRAIYFNDTVAVGFVKGSDVLEFVAQDGRQGGVFYTLKQSPDAVPVFERNSAVCVQCHAFEGTQYVPGMFIGSVYPGADGLAMYGPTFTTDHRSLFERRWGGWFVTGTHSGASHMGNAVVTNPADLTSMITPETVHVTDLAGRFDGAEYQSMSSDLVALLVIEHQSQMLNRLTRIGWEARIGTAAVGRPLTEMASDVVDYMLFVDETVLPGPIAGTTAFAERFQQGGPRDQRGRSLRELDLRTRLLKYPCSYLIYSEPFTELPAEAKAAIYASLWAVLSGAETAPRYARLTAGDRQAILEILRDTKPDLPDYFRAAPRS